MKLGALLLALSLVTVSRDGARAQDHSARAQPAAEPRTAAPGQGAGTAAVNEEVTQSLKTGAPEHETPKQEGGRVDIIMPHITNARHMEVPWILPPFYKQIHLPHWKPVQIGGLTLDLSPTKHVVFLIVAATLCALILILAAAAHGRHHHAVGRPRGFASGLEAVVLYVRNEVILANVGPGGAGYAPLLLTFFFFILTANLLGLVPYGSTVTGNISVTATLAIISFIVIEIAGMRALGKGYVNTVIYWPHEGNIAMRIFLSLILTPVELIGKFTKPFALAIRLFANMTAGHVMVLALIGIIFTFGSYIIAPVPLAMTLAIMLFEVFVALLQAYIFTMLVSVFIGQIRTAHH